MKELKKRGKDLTRKDLDDFERQRNSYGINSIRKIVKWQIENNRGLYDNKGMELLNKIKVV